MRAPAGGGCRIRDARANNLQTSASTSRTGVLTVVTGVAGSGKSSLINEAFLRQHPGGDRHRPVRRRHLAPARTRPPTPA